VINHVCTVPVVGVFNHVIVIVLVIGSMMIWASAFTLDDNK